VNVWEGCQAASESGGARVEGDAEKWVAGAPGRDSATLPPALRAENVAVQGCGLAHRGVVTPRQQSWLQQPELWIASLLDSELAEP
jgi:hypothetical protein